jgi:two-component system chemotaxis sensor kinase CheA
MNALLQQFIHESRDFLQSISELLLQLEQSPQNQQIIVELFRSVHTLKGNSGLFEFTAMTQVLHAAEDLMDKVRDGHLAFSAEIADQLLDAMDFVSGLLDCVAANNYDNDAHMARSATEAAHLRQLLSAVSNDSTSSSMTDHLVTASLLSADDFAAGLKQFPLSVQQALTQFGDGHVFVYYQPEAECFFKGEDPFYLMQRLSEVVWSAALPASNLQLTPYDCYQSQLDYLAVTTLDMALLLEHFRYVTDQVKFFTLSSAQALEPATAVQSKVEGAYTLDPDLVEILQTQLVILEQQITNNGPIGIVAAVYRTLAALQLRIPLQTPPLQSDASALALSAWVAQVLAQSECSAAVTDVSVIAEEIPDEQVNKASTEPDLTGDIRFERRAEDTTTVKVLKVEQTKIDRLMDLIGEIVVAKNALPYLANKAEDQYSNREMSREIKAQYAVINRIVEEMQDAIMQVRMMPVSFIFQRFPRLVRDIARKLGKEVELHIHGEQTEADKSIIESLADPLIHILRNSLDHGFETAEERKAAGKPGIGQLKIRASQEADRVVIVIEDDGRGIDPAVIKRKAWEKNLISEDQLEKLSDQDAIQLIFAAGFSTAAQVTDLSGRGVGMDVVKTAVLRVGGAVQLSSEVGKGTRLSLSLPLSMAVTNVMVVGSDQQIFGIPMDLIVETVRLPMSAVRHIKQQMTTILRGKIIPLRSLNQLLGIEKPQQLNDEQEYALLVVKTQGEVLGLLVDDFFEVIDIILKPLPGELGKMPFYSGSALLGDGSVLLILNPQEFS